MTQVEEAAKILGQFRYDGHDRWIVAARDDQVFAGNSTKSTAMSHDIAIKTAEELKRQAAAKPEPSEEVKLAAEAVADAVSWAIHVKGIEAAAELHAVAVEALAEHVHLFAKPEPEPATLKAIRFLQWATTGFEGVDLDADAGEWWFGDDAGDKRITFGEIREAIKEQGIDT